MSILEVNDVSIRYMTGDFKDIGLKEYVVRKIKGNYHVNEFWADRHITFSLEKGDMLGIIGTNGAGKSTLLKAVSGIMEPTGGYVKRCGNIAALLELASGFDGDLTVRENAYLRGAMLGYTRRFMDEKYDEIIDFAELRNFQDQPFKQLSSGMKSRLAFSIASLVQPDILILDEVLSVGDGAFREKSAKKMREIISQGATSILVSHSLSQIRELCNKVLWLDHGRQVAFGETQEICDQYERFLRGERPVELQKEAQTVKTGKSSSGQNTQRDWITAGRPSAKRIIAGLAVAVFVAIFAYNLGAIWLQKWNDSRVVISAYEGSGEVTFRGAFVEKNWVNPADHVTESSGWSYDAQQDVYTALDGQPLVFRLPMGRDRRLIFYAGPDAGVVSVDLDGEHFEFDLHNETAKELGSSYQVLDKNGYQRLAFALISFAAAFLLFLVLWKEKPRSTDSARVVWIDALKVISALMVVQIHSAGTLYNQNFNVNHTLWMQGLWANAIPRFAVPCFLMITGAMSLTKHYDFKKVKSKVLHFLTVLFFWNLMHVLFAHIRWGDSFLDRVLKIPFERQDGSLWYLYQLVWLMLGMPFWNLLWQALTAEKRWAFVIVSLGIPGLLTQLEEILVLNTNEYLPSASTNPVLCYVGMLFLGRLLYESVERNSPKKVMGWGVGGIAAGLLIMVTSSAYVSHISQKSVHTFFYEARIPGVLYGAGVFLCFGALKNMFLSMPEWIKEMLTSLSGVSLGVYASHALLIYKVLPQTIMVMGAEWNIRVNMQQLLGCVLVYYGMTVSICLLLSKIPVLKRLVT